MLPGIALGRIPLRKKRTCDTVKLNCLALRHGTKGKIQIRGQTDDCFQCRSSMQLMLARVVRTPERLYTCSKTEEGLQVRSAWSGNGFGLSGVVCRFLCYYPK